MLALPSLFIYNSSIINKELNYVPEPKSIRNEASTQSMGFYISSINPV